MNSSKNKKAYIKTPVKGMNDFLPSDVRLRERVLNIIKENYKKYGFTQIETPCMEHIENLTTNEGGENEKLIFIKNLLNKFYTFCILHCTLTIISI